MAYKAPTVGKGGNKKIIFDYNQFEDYIVYCTYFTFLMQARVSFNKKIRNTTNIHAFIQTYIETSRQTQKIMVTGITER